MDVIKQILWTIICMFLISGFIMQNIHTIMSNTTENELYDENTQNTTSINSTKNETYDENVQKAACKSGASKYKIVIIILFFGFIIIIVLYIIILYLYRSYCLHIRPRIANMFPQIRQQENELPREVLFEPLNALDQNDRNIRIQ